MVWFLKKIVFTLKSKTIMYSSSHNSILCILDKNECTHMLWLQPFCILLSLNSYILNWICNRTPGNLCSCWDMSAATQPYQKKNILGQPWYWCIASHYDAISKDGNSVTVEMTCMALCFSNAFFPVTHATRERIRIKALLQSRKFAWLSWIWSS